MVPSQRVTADVGAFECVDGTAQPIAVSTVWILQGGDEVQQLEGSGAEIIIRTIEFVPGVNYTLSVRLSANGMMVEDATTLRLTPAQHVIDLPAFATGSMMEDVVIQAVVLELPQSIVEDGDHTSVSWGCASGCVAGAFSGESGLSLTVSNSVLGASSISLTVEMTVTIQYDDGSSFTSSETTVVVFVEDFIQIEAVADDIPVQGIDPGLPFSIVYRIGNFDLSDVTISHSLVREVSGDIVYGDALESLLSILSPSGHIVQFAPNALEAGAAYLLHSTAVSSSGSTGAVAVRLVTTIPPEAGLFSLSSTSFTFAESTSLQVNVANSFSLDQSSVEYIVAVDRAQVISTSANISGLRLAPGPHALAVQVCIASLCSDVEGEGGVQAITVGDATLSEMLAQVELALDEARESMVHADVGRLGAVTSQAGALLSALEDASADETSLSMYQSGSCDDVAFLDSLILAHDDFLTASVPLFDFDADVKLVMEFLSSLTHSLASPSSVIDFLEHMAVYGCAHAEEMSLEQIRLWLDRVSVFVSHSLRNFACVDDASVNFDDYVRIDQLGWENALCVLPSYSPRSLCGSDASLFEPVHLNYTFLSYHDIDVTDLSTVNVSLLEGNVIVPLDYVQAAPASAVDASSCVHVAVRRIFVPPMTFSDALGGRVLAESTSITHAKLLFDAISGSVLPFANAGGNIQMTFSADNVSSLNRDGVCYAYNTLTDGVAVVAGATAMVSSATDDTLLVDCVWLSQQQFQPSNSAALIGYGAIVLFPCATNFQDDLAGGCVASASLQSAEGDGSNDKTGVQLSSAVIGGVLGICVLVILYVKRKLHLSSKAVTLATNGYAVPASEEDKTLPADYASTTSTELL